MEVGVAVNLDIPIIMFEQDTVKDKAYISEFARYKYMWNTEDNLYKQIIKVLNKID